MVLVDTSVWIDHLRSDNDRLRGLLENGEVVCHPFVVGELACGNLANREEILGLMNDIPSIRPVSDSEAMFFLESNGLSGQGVGWIDIHLLAAARVVEAPVWTLDRRLRRAARATGQFWG